MTLIVFVIAIFLPLLLALLVILKNSNIGRKALPDSKQFFPFECGFNAKKGLPSVLYISILLLNNKIL